jgi:hypothetical protein
MAVPDKSNPQTLVDGWFDHDLGRLSNGGEVTLTASAGSTTVTRRGVSAGDGVFLMPMTANAAAALATTYIVPAKGQFVITHANNAQADKTFRYVFFKGAG